MVPLYIIYIYTYIVQYCDSSSSKAISEYSTHTHDITTTIEVCPVYLTSVRCVVWEGALLIHARSGAPVSCSAVVLLRTFLPPAVIEITTTCVRECVCV